MLRCSAQDRHQLFVLERLLDVVEGAVVHCPNRRLQTRLRRHQNDNCVGVVRAHRGQNVEAGDIRHSDVGDDQVGLECRDLLEAFLAAERSVGNEAFALQKNSNGVENSLLVVDDEDGRGRACDSCHAGLLRFALGVRRRDATSSPSLGMITVNFVPLPLPLPSTRMKP